MDKISNLVGSIGIGVSAIGIIILNISSIKRQKLGIEVVMNIWKIISGYNLKEWLLFLLLLALFFSSGIYLAIQ